jgi:ATP-dependent exoDNAse (exonuclease V) alpha subunit
MTTLTPKRSLAEIIAEKRRLSLLSQQQQELKAEAITSLAPVKEQLATIVEAPLNPTTPVSAAVKQKLSIREILALKTTNNNADSVGERSEPQNSLSPTTITTITLPTNLVKSEPHPTTTEYPVPRLVSTTLGMTAAQIAEVKAEIAAERELKETERSKETFSLSISLNPRQLLAKEMAFAGKSFCLIGAAGTGKTTTQRDIAAELLKSGKLRTHDFRVQGTGERITAPSIAFVAFTRVASANLRRAIHKLPELERSLRHNVTTIHNLLEYTPEEFYDDVLQKTSFRFIPMRTANNQLDITHLVVEEASMVGLDLWSKLLAALRPGVQIIFIGDINQLPPVFDTSILNYGLVQLPVVELDHVYRQAGDSTILTNAHNILAGLPLVEAPDFKIVTGGTTNHTQARLAASLGMTFPKWEAAGEYDPMQDIILSPWNKRDLGTDNMNKWIAQFLGVQRNAVVHQIIAGVTTLHLAVGDKVMSNKQVGVITSIVQNPYYMGRTPLPASTSLNRFGTYTGDDTETLEELENLDTMDYSNLNLDKMLEEIDDEKKREASHSVGILLDDGETISLKAIGDFSSSTFSLAYALTVHKAQGCEWRKVFFILHRDHSVSLCRELLYTAVTRAREKMILIAKHDVIVKAIKTQRIKGNTLKDKIEYFNADLQLNNAVKCTK